MKELIKKKFEINVLNEKVIFEQLSMYECIEKHFEIYSEDFDLLAFMKDFFKSYKIDITKIDPKKFIEMYTSYAMKDFYCKSKGGDDEAMPYEAYIAFLSKELNIAPLSLLKEYTPEAINFLSNGVLFNINEQTKEGKKRNAIKKLMKENVGDNDRDLEEIKKMREKLK